MGAFFSLQECRWRRSWRLENLSARNNLRVILYAFPRPRPPPTTVYTVRRCIWFSSKRKVVVRGSVAEGPILVANTRQDNAVSRNAATIFSRRRGQPDLRSLAAAAAAEDIVGIGLYTRRCLLVPATMHERCTSLLRAWEFIEMVAAEVETWQSRSILDEIRP